MINIDFKEARNMCQDFCDMFVARKTIFYGIIRFFQWEVKQMKVFGD